MYLYWYTQAIIHLVLFSLTFRLTRSKKCPVPVDLCNDTLNQRSSGISSSTPCQGDINAKIYRHAERRRRILSYILRWGNTPGLPITGTMYLKPINSIGYPNAGYVLIKRYDTNQGDFPVWNRNHLPIGSIPQLIHESWPYNIFLFSWTSRNLLSTLWFDKQNNNLISLLFRPDETIPE